MDEEVSALVSPVEAMALAAREGLRGQGRVAPNPLVGCAIVDREHRLLALGHHARLGGPHAEIQALAQIADAKKLEGAHVYVTLEPCAHEGRTGSCAKALAKLPIASVVYAVQDPNPKVSGAGGRILREAGIAARELSQATDLFSSEEIERMRGECEDLAEVFLRNHRAHAPFVSLKVATTLDGQMAMASGESKWITGPEARAKTHWLRAGHDAVLIGRRTFELDNPRLDPRAAGLEDLRNAVVLLDPMARSAAKLAGSALLQARGADRVFVIASQAAPADALARASDAGVRVLKAPVDAAGAFAVDALLAALWSADLRSVFVEGGARAYATFAAAREFQRLHAFVAPVVLGGRKGHAWSKDFGFDSLAAGLRLARSRSEPLGSDVYVTGRADI